MKSDDKFVFKFVECRLPIENMTDQVRSTTRRQPSFYFIFLFFFIIRCATFRYRGWSRTTSPTLMSRALKIQPRSSQQENRRHSKIYQKEIQDETAAAWLQYRKNISETRFPSKCLDMKETFAPSDFLTCTMR